MVAINTVYHGTTHPSRIVLPLTGPDQDGDGIYDILDSETEASVEEHSLTLKVIAAFVVCMGLHRGKDALVRIHNLYITLPT